MNSGGHNFLEDKLSEPSFIGETLESKGKMLAEFQLPITSLSFSLSLSLSFSLSISLSLSLSFSLSLYLSLTLPPSFSAVQYHQLTGWLVH